MGNFHFQCSTYIQQCIKSYNAFSTVKSAAIYTMALSDAFDENHIKDAKDSCEILQGQ